MANQDATLKDALQKKSLPEIEAMLAATRKKISEEKDLMKLSRLNSDLSALQEIRDKKIGTSGRQIRKPATASKPALKSFDDYVKSKK
jgi:uncharacterized coiled-coil protein SlyX